MSGTLFKEILYFFNLEFAEIFFLMNPVFKIRLFLVDFQIRIHFYALKWREKETFKLGSFLAILLTTIHVSIYFRFKQLVRDARFTCKQSTARNFATVGSICSDLWKATQGLKYTALLKLIFSGCYVKLYWWRKNLIQRQWTNVLILVVFS